LTVFHTPVRLTSSITCQSCSDSSSAVPRPAIPALAATMSSRPNRSRAVSTTSSSAARSRTSARTATIRRSSSSTNFTVSSRSAGAEVELTQIGWADQLDAVLDGRIDAMLARPPLPERPVRRILLLTEPRVLVMAADHPLARRETLCLADLADVLQVNTDGVDESWRASNPCLCVYALGGSYAARTGTPREAGPRTSRTLSVSTRSHR
jgi:DNA-binding transcriptional LysR family regulator